jgi:UDP:flavonoid glycosyltransferase YjiC (YdhE family)
MRIVMVAAGSRGDVQPYVALGRGLKNAGHRVRLVTTLNYEALVTAHGLEFWPVEMNMQEMVETERMRALLESGNLLTQMAELAKMGKQSVVKLATRSLEAAQDTDLVMGGLSGMFIAAAVAEKMGLPMVQAHNVPFTPTRAFPGALMPAPPGWVGHALNRLTHHVTRQILWQTARPGDRVARRQVFGLSPFPVWGPFGSAILGQSPVLYGISLAVITPPPDWDPARIHVTGYWFLPPSETWRPPESLERFLEAGPPPVYIGFGSMSNRKPEETADLVLKALAETGQRGIVFSGWAGLQKADLPDSVLMIDSTPHTWLFPRMSAVVHHGGAGTTAAGLRAGVPSVVVPFHGDQPFWGRLVANLGVGPVPIPRRKLTAERLVQALTIARDDPTMRQRAADLGAKIRDEDGVANAVARIQQRQTSL